MNVLGILNRHHHLEAYVSTQSINFGVVIACIGTFFPVVDQPTVIVMDQASIHLAMLFTTNLKRGKSVTLQFSSYLLTLLS